MVVVGYRYPAPELHARLARFGKPGWHVNSAETVDSMVRESVGLWETPLTAFLSDRARTLESFVARLVDQVFAGTPRPELVSVVSTTLNKLVAGMLEEHDRHARKL